MTEVDQVARDAANTALLTISAHEKVCIERQGHIIESLGDIKRDMTGLYSRFWVAAIFLITSLVGVVGSLVYLILSRAH